MSDKPKDATHASPGTRTFAAPSPRTLVQYSFLFVVILIGIKFRTFVMSLADPSAPVAARPAGVEAFLPISSLMSLVHWFKTGTLSRVHPAGLVLFALILVLAVAARRGFCSWVCPVGTISEFLHKAGKRIVGTNLDMPKWIDYPAKGLKYIVLGFFLYFILPLPGPALEAFLGAPYNRMADVKMYLFFANISRTALFVIVALAVLSVFIKNFWCRYLCPYGALLGLASLFSPVAVRRREHACRNCGACARACPNGIAVDKKGKVYSPECMLCWSCVDACPAKGALAVEAPHGRRVPAAAYAALMALAFAAVPVLARSVGFWNPDTSPQAYKQLYAVINMIDHPSPGGAPAPGNMMSMPLHGGAPHGAMSPSAAAGQSAARIPDAVSGQGPDADAEMCPGLNPDSPLAADLQEARRRVDREHQENPDSPESQTARPKAR